MSKSIQKRLEADFEANNVQVGHFQDLASSPSKIEVAAPPSKTALDQDDHIAILNTNAVQPQSNLLIKKKTSAQNQPKNSMFSFIDDGTPLKKQAFSQTPIQQRKAPKQIMQSSFDTENIKELKRGGNNIKEKM